jgi:8-oxo-dGTP diphosphatase
MLPVKTLCFLWRGEPPTEMLLGFKKTGLGAGKYLGFGGGVEPERGETILEAAVRELEEECCLTASVENLEQVAHLEFIFPEKPAWDQVVHVFVVKLWSGDAAETDEMRPGWVAIDNIPYDSMWEDCHHWLPQVIQGQRLQGRFVFKGDNETVDYFTLSPLEMAR